MIFTSINSNTGRGIYDYARFVFAECSLHRAHVADLDIFVGERDKVKISKDSAKVGAQLSIGTCNYDSHLSEYIVW